MLYAIWVHDIHRKGRHEQRSIIRRNLQDSQPGMRSYIQGSDPLFPGGGGETEQSPQHFHYIHILLPDVESARAEINGEDPVDGLFIVEVHGDGF